MKFYIDTYPEIFEDYNKELNGKDYTDISDDEIHDDSGGTAPMKIAEPHTK